MHVMLTGTKSSDTCCHLTWPAPLAATWNTSAHNLNTLITFREKSEEEEKRGAKRKSLAKGKKRRKEKNFVFFSLQLFVNFHRMNGVRYTKDKKMMNKGGNCMRWIVCEKFNWKLSWHSRNFLNSIGSTRWRSYDKNRKCFKLFYISAFITFLA